MMGATTGILQTPTEIFERILDFLHDDRAALCSASLVSREWVHTPRHHLFHRTAVTELYGRDDMVLKENVHAFLALIKSKHCTILSAIRCVVLWVTTPELIEDVLRVLGRQSKTLSQMVYVHCANSKPPAITHGLSNVHEFTFDFVPSAVFDDDAWRLVASFPNLRNLTIHTDSYGTFTPPPDMSSSPFLNLRTLRLKLAPSEELFGWLMNFDGSHFILDTLELRMLRQNPNGWGSVEALNSFLKGISATLKHLTLGIDYVSSIRDMDHDPNAEASRIDLSPLDNLQSLCFRTHDLKSVCNSLESLNDSYAMLDVLTVHVLPFGQTLPYRQTSGRCDCHLDGDNLTRLSGIVEGKQFIKTSVQLRLDIRRDLEVDATRELVERWISQRVVLRLSYYTLESSVRDAQLTWFIRKLTIATRIF